MTPDQIDTMEIARTELASQMFPAPEDMFDDITPLAGLFYVEQCAVELYKVFVASLSAENTPDMDTSEGAGKALAAIGQALGMLDVACVAMGILPPEAAP